MSSVEYPYLPNGRSFRFVPETDVLMQSAMRARDEQAGDRVFPVGVVLVKAGKVVASAGNGFNRGVAQVHVCPRIVLSVPSGTGYDLCTFHDPSGHAETMLMQIAREQGITTQGADVYLYGHWWCCEPCWKSMIEAGIRDVYLVEQAHELFARERVLDQTLRPSVERVYLAGAYTVNGELERLKQEHWQYGEVCEALGCTTVLPFRDNPENKKARELRDRRFVFDWTLEQVRGVDVLVADVSAPSHGVGAELMVAQEAGKPIVLLSDGHSAISNFVLGMPSVVYMIVSDDQATRCEQLKQVLRQL